MSLTARKYVSCWLLGEIRDVPLILYVPLLTPCLDSEKLCVAVDLMKGAFLVSLAQKGLIHFLLFFLCGLVTEFVVSNTFSVSIVSNFYGKRQYLRLACAVIVAHTFRDGHELLRSRPHPGIRLLRWFSVRSWQHLTVEIVTTVKWKPRNVYRIKQMSMFSAADANSHVSGCPLIEKLMNSVLELQ